MYQQSRIITHMYLQNKLKKRRPRSYRRVGSSRQMAQEEKYTRFQSIAESFYFNNAIVASSGFNRKMLVVSFLRQFRRVTVDDLVLALIIQNFVEPFPECTINSSDLSGKKLLQVLGEPLDIDIEATLPTALEVPARSLELLFPDAISSPTLDPFVCEQNWVESSSPPCLDARFNQAYSPYNRAAAPAAVIPSSPSTSPDEAMDFQAAYVNLQIPEHAGYATGFPFLMNQAAGAGAADAVVVHSGFDNLQYMNNMMQLQVPAPVPQLQPYVDDCETKLEPFPEPMAAPQFEFNSMHVTDIVRQRLALVELAEYGLLERFLTDPNGTKYLQWRIKSEFSGNTAECIQFISDNIVSLSRSKYICRVVQELLKEIDDKQVVTAMAAAFRKQCEQGSLGTLPQCLECCHANRVLQVLVQLGLPFADLKFVADELNRDLVHYSEDRNACHLVQCFIQMYGDKIDIKRLLVNKAHLYLAKTLYGNYVIQRLITRGEWYSKQAAFVGFREKFIYDIFSESNLEYFCKHKQGSHIIEECIRSSSPKQIAYLINILCRAQASLLRKLLRDKIGNFIPKTLLKYANRKQQFFIANTVHAYIVNLSCCRQYLANFKHCAEFIDACARMRYRAN